MELAEVKLVQQGANMTDADILEWLVNEGEHVDKGQEMVEVDAAKASFFITAPVSGVIKSIKKQVDDNVHVGEIIAIIETDES